MRFLKKLLIAVLLYLGAFGIMVYIGWLITKDEPAALVAGVFGTGIVEALVGGVIKLIGDRNERKNKNAVLQISQDGEQTQNLRGE